MLKRTAPAVSFTTSHRALMMRSSRPLLGHDLTSTERVKAAWDEMPVWLFNKNRKESMAWDWKCRYELGIRDNFEATKGKYWFIRGMFFLWIPLTVEFIGPQLYMAATGGLKPKRWSKEYGPTFAKKFGYEVFCADGKFVKPFFHICPPMFTMTADEL